MRALYFDCFSGISGDMTLGALLDLGVDQKEFLEEIGKLGIDGYHITFDKAVKNGITGNYVKVHLADELQESKGVHEHHIHGEACHAHSVEFHTHHAHRNLGDIIAIIDRSAIKPEAKELAKRIFLRVAKAEAKVHNRSLEEVHFHEVGAVDSIVDIVGCAILIDMLKPDMVYASVINDGRGFIQCQHGQLSVPVPAVSEIFAASDAVCRQIDVETELVTPTGAAIITELASSYGNMPTMNVQKIGWGAGTKDLQVPNLLKVSLGETQTSEANQVMILETNLDDCTGEALGFLMERLFEEGALDVFFTPIFMKKNRPAYCLSVISRIESSRKIEELIFINTTSIGIRKRVENRTVLKRELGKTTTRFGELKVKKVFVDGMQRIYPEYESAKELALQNKISLREVYQSAKECHVSTKGD